MAPLMEVMHTMSFSRGQSARSVASCQPLGLHISPAVIPHTVDILLVAGEVDGLEAALLDERRGGLGRLGEGRPGGSVDGGHEGPLLDGRGLGGLPQGAAESSGCCARSHFCCVCGVEMWLMGGRRCFASEQWQAR